MRSPKNPVWRTPEEIVEIAFQRATVVMMNEAHSGWKRCIRTRQVGKRILPVAHQAGARHLAMEALFSQFAEECNKTRRLMRGDFGYLSQPEMMDLIETALDLETLFTIAAALGGIVLAPIWYIWTGLRLRRASI